MASKKVELLIEITEDGKINASPKGTQGTECLDLMAFLDKIPGLTVEETVKQPGLQNEKVQIVGHQFVNATH